MLICPICDGRLSGRFCPVCKRIVKEPWVLDDRIFINRSHSLPDDFCEYHGNDRKVTYLNRTAERTSPVISGKVNPLKQANGSISASRRSTPAPRYGASPAGMSSSAPAGSAFHNAFTKTKPVNYPKGRQLPESASRKKKAVFKKTDSILSID